MLDLIQPILILAGLGVALWVLSLPLRRNPEEKYAFCFKARIYIVKKVPGHEHAEQCADPISSEWARYIHLINRTIDRAGKSADVGPDISQLEDDRERNEKRIRRRFWYRFYRDNIQFVGNADMRDHLIVGSYLGKF